MTYEIITDLPDNHPLSDPPAQLWLLLVLEVVVADDKGTYLLLNYPSYALEYDGLSEVMESYWTPPYRAHPVPLDYSVPDTVGAVHRWFSGFEETISFHSDINHLAYLMGLPNADTQPCGSFIELKKSPRTPDRTKCFKIVRFRLQGLGHRGRLNLSDPECRKGYVYLPLDNLNSVTKNIYSPSHGRSQMHYLGKPIISNVESILSSPTEIVRLKHSAITLKAHEFFYSEKGLLIVFDLAGYGKTCQYAKDHMQSFGQEGIEIANQFRRSVAEMLNDLLLHCGITQVQLAGDGFLAAAPERLFFGSTPFSFVEQFLEEYGNLTSKLESLNKYISDPEWHVGSRLALHYGHYRYGRVALATSIAPGFDGLDIIEVSRLEAALREVAYGRRSMAITKDENGYVARLETEVASPPEISSRLKHTLICSEALINGIPGNIGMPRGWQQLGARSVAIKEAQFRGTVYLYEDPS